MRIVLACYHRGMICQGYRVAFRKCSFGRTVVVFEELTPGHSNTELLMAVGEIHAQLSKSENYTWVLFHKSTSTARARYQQLKLVKSGGAVAALFFGASLNMKAFEAITSWTQLDSNFSSIKTKFAVS